MLYFTSSLLAKNFPLGEQQVDHAAGDVAIGKVEDRAEEDDVHPAPQREIRQKRRVDDRGIEHIYHAIVVERRIVE